VFSLNIDYFIQVLYSIWGTIILTLKIISVSFIIEKVTGLKLLVSTFYWKKNLYNAKTSAVGSSVTFFFLNVIVYIYDLIKGYVVFNIFSFIVWLLLIIFLKRLLYRIYYKYQSIDPNKADDDYS